jgi:hypothetical protein
MKSDLLKILILKNGWGKNSRFGRFEHKNSSAIFIEFQNLKKNAKTALNVLPLF